MKNEDRIVELLAESLIKQDQQANLLGKMIDTLGTMGNTLGTMSGTLDKHSGLLQTIVTQLGALTEHEKRITRLENRVFKK